MHFVRYYFACQRWLAIGEDDGQIARVLVPVDKNKVGSKNDKAIKDELALENKGKV